MKTRIKIVELKNGEKYYHPQELMEPTLIIILALVMTIFFLIAITDSECRKEMFSQWWWSDITNDQYKNKLDAQAIIDRHIEAEKDVLKSEKEETEKERLKKPKKTSSYKYP